MRDTDPAVLTAASRVSDRIRGTAKAVGADGGAVGALFVVERFLHRLSRSRHAENFVLKGGILMFSETAAFDRPTEDIDAHSDRALTGAEAIAVVDEVASMEPQDAEDGLVFDVGALRAQTIVEAHVPGLRISCPVRLAHVLPKQSDLRLKIDLAWGDRIPAPRQATIRSVIKGFEPVRMSVYPWEQVLAEKLHALARHGVETTRMKDFYDLWVLSGRPDLIDAEVAAIAIRDTFESWRSPPLTDEIEALTQWFAEARDGDWARFATGKGAKSGRPSVRNAPISFIETVAAIKDFADPHLSRARSLGLFPAPF